MLNRCSGITSCHRTYTWCDLGNLPHVAHGNFVEINKIILKLLCFSWFLINFDNTYYVTLDVGIIETKFNLFQKEEITIF